MQTLLEGRDWIRRCRLAGNDKDQRRAARRRIADKAHRRGVTVFHDCSATVATQFSIFIGWGNNLSENDVLGRGIGIQSRINKPLPARRAIAFRGGDDANTATVASLKVHYRNKPPRLSGATRKTGFAWRISVWSIAAVGRVASTEY
jgi:hypothetical protein